LKLGNYAELSISIPLQGTNILVMADPKPQLAVSDAKVVVGPVIGKVTHNTARVLVEVDEAIEVTCKLERANHEGGCIFKSKTLQKGIPGVFVFDDLFPSTTYNVSFPNCSNHADRTGP
jgi:hypothetical protein